MKSLLTLLQAQEFIINKERYTVGETVYNKENQSIKFLDYVVSTNAVKYSFMGADRWTTCNASWTTLYRKNIE